MRETTSLTTGNVFFHADNGFLSSSSKQAVESFEKQGLEKKQDFFGNHSLAVQFMHAGSCPIAEEYFSDYCKIWNELNDFEKSLKKGNWCPLKVNAKVKERKAELWKERGYNA